MFDRAKSAESFFELLNQLEATKKKTGEFKIYSRNGEIYRIEIEVKSGEKVLRMIKPENERD